MLNRLEDVNVEEVSLVDEPATGKRFLIFKQKMRELKQKGRRLLFKEKVREDLYALKDAVPLEEEGSYRVFIGFNEENGVPGDEELNAYCEQRVKDWDIGEKVFDYDFDAAVTEDDKPIYVPGIIWTKERKQTQEAPAMPGLSAFSPTGTPAGSMPEIGLTNAGPMEPMPTGGGKIQARDPRATL